MHLSSAHIAPILLFACTVLVSAITSVCFVSLIQQPCLGQVKYGYSPVARRYHGYHPSIVFEQHDCQSQYNTASFSENSHQQAQDVQSLSHNDALKSASRVRDDDDYEASTTSFNFFASAAPEERQENDECFGESKGERKGCSEQSSSNATTATEKNKTIFDHIYKLGLDWVEENLIAKVTVVGALTVLVTWILCSCIVFIFLFDDRLLHSRK
eukprot:GEZU01009692.1.p1 GENE.GEZU01009692.1~~GEZU01009692.1.p1  ORF type:complete len:213 (+),score=19.31 GEZU01009692.1:507-1145(+)